MLHIRVPAYVCMYAHSGAFQFREIMHCKGLLFGPKFSLYFESAGRMWLEREGSLNAVYETRAVPK
jgi:hypothetical protein